MSDNPDEVTERLYAAVGRSITAWFSLEEALCDVFGRTLICSIGGGFKLTPSHCMFTIGAIFHTPTNFRTKLDLVDTTVLQTVSDDALLQEWKSIKNKVGRISKKRNRIAHSSAWGNETEGCTSLGYSIFKREPKRMTMNIDDIVGATESFIETAARTTDFAIAVNKHLVRRG